MTKPVSERMKIDSLLARAGIKCICGLTIVPGDKIEWDHGVPDGLGGAHSYENIRPLHKLCHAAKTFGTKATTAGSDVHMIAKAKRIAKGGKKRKGRKIKSRGFDKTKSKHFDGSVTERALAGKLMRGLE